jgi:ABC-type nitrate/sulfonate/bicarbonate transport system substrate-binding protein
MKIEYGIPTDREGLQLRLGVEKGFFREEGLDLSLKVVFGGPEIAAEYDSGGLKIGEMGTPPALTAIAKGHRFKIVGSSVRRGAVQYLVAATRLQKWSDLVGCRLAALTIGSCSYWFMRELLIHNGLDPDKDLTIVGLGERYPKVVDLIRQGELDGAVISEPNVTIGEQAGSFRVWTSLAEVDFMPRLQWCVCVANNTVIDQEPDLVEAVLRASRRSYRYAAENQDEWAAFGARYFGIAHGAMQRAIAREIDSLHFDCEIDVDGLKAAIALQQKLGAFNRPLGLKDVGDFRFQPPAIRSAA